MLESTAKDVKIIEEVQQSVGYVSALLELGDDKTRAREEDHFKSSVLSTGYKASGLGLELGKTSDQKFAERTDRLFESR